ncbi:MAG: outer membrane protein assembly factor BamA, partial [Alphaproteobacteria bacterium]|nr:outer membrane protein assembly factor BamA [Alphaproteobacteria bacterium]
MTSKPLTDNGIKSTSFLFAALAAISLLPVSSAMAQNASFGRLDLDPVVPANRGFAAPAPAPVVSADTSVVNIVEVRGNQRVETQTVKSYLNLTEGKAYSRKDINAALKRLFETGFFSDIKFSRNAGTLTVIVVENPVINRVVFEGNDHLEDDDLKKEVVLQPRSIYTRTQVQNDVKRLLDLYRASGRYSATVVPKVVPLEQNRVNLVYEISEGTVTTIQKISFVGNTQFSDEVLTETIRSQEARWYRFLTSDDRYDADRVQYDQELLRRFYVSNGYADFQVKSAVTELTPDKQGFYLTYTIEEGKQYRFGNIKLDNRLSGSDSKPLETAITSKTGEVYNSQQVEETVDKMVTNLGDQGFAFVEVSPEVDRDVNNSLINLTFRINEGPRVYVERININGNVRTLDEVVRREFRLAEGDAYNTSKLRRSEQRINNLGYFENVKVEEKRGSAPDKIVLDTNLQERSTGELTFGVGFSTADGPLADVGIREKNLLGRGQDLRARVMAAAERQQIDLGFTEPYFMNRDIAAGFDLYRIDQDLQQESSFERQTTGGTLRANYALSERWRHTVNYNLRQTNITDVDPT